MMIHQDGSSHEWVAGQKWDLIVTLDDAISEHYSLFFVDEEDTASSFRGVHDVIAARGLLNAFYSDRGIRLKRAEKLTRATPPSSDGR